MTSISPRLQQRDALRVASHLAEQDLPGAYRWAINSDGGIDVLLRGHFHADVDAWARALGTQVKTANFCGKPDQLVVSAEATYEGVPVTAWLTVDCIPVLYPTSVVSPSGREANAL